MSERESALNQLRFINDTTLKKGGSGRGTSVCYKVEARCCKGCGPKIIDEYTKLTDTEWTPLHFPASRIGVPAAPYNEEYARHGYLSYQAAQALRWWFIAEQGGLSFLETRLVKYQFKHEYSAEPVEALALIDPEQREDIMYDWGKPKDQPAQSSPKTEGA